MLMDSAGQDVGQGSAEMLYVYSTTSGALVWKKHMAGIIGDFFHSQAGALMRMVRRLSSAL